MSKNLRGLSERKGLNENLFKAISKCNSVSSIGKDDHLLKLSENFLMGRSSILGASSFYDFLTAEHSLKKVYICDGSACLTSGGQSGLREALLARFNEDEIGTVTCLGHCHTNHSFMYNGQTYALDDLNTLNTALTQKTPLNPKINTGTNADKPLLLSEPDNFSDYLSLLKRYSVNYEQAFKEIELSALRGRGGAGFPFYLKLKAASAATSAQKYIVCNADEGDPGAFSDKWLLEERPHLILSGMMISGILTGADTGIVYIRGEYPEAVKAVHIAVRELEAAKLSEINIAGSGKTFNFHIIEGAGAYICGEETSLLNSLEGLRPEVRTRPPFPAEYGLFGRPTLLSNVETFANLPFILLEGGAAFSAIGTVKSTGTKLVSLDGAFKKPGLYEVKMGTPLNYVFDKMGGGSRYPVKAYQIGGPLGGIIPVSKIKDVTLDFESFSSNGFLLGHAGVVSIPESFSMIEYLTHLFEFTSRESCGKCFPCRIGADRGSELLRRSIEGKEKIDRDLLLDLLETLELGSLCALGGGLPLPVRNILEYFSAEMEEYFKPKHKSHG